jgi:putative transcriptional regulator
MNNTNHHPSEELLATYSAASLPMSHALCISTHIEHCHECASKAKRLNLVGSELMQQLKPSPPSSVFKKSLFDNIDALSDKQEKANEKTEHIENNTRLPHCLTQFITGDYGELDWKRVSPDIHSFELCRDSNGAKVELLKIKAGGTSSTHTHMGDEYTVILEGSFSDEDGVYGQGDFMLRDSSHQHTPVATQDRECICLAVTEAPIQLTGIFGRMLNPLIRRNHS